MPFESAVFNNLAVGNSFKPPRPAVSGVVQVGGYIPMVQKPTGWWLPGGKYNESADPLEVIENQKHTLIDEFFEETGLVITPSFYLITDRHPHPDILKAQDRSMAYWVCDYVEGTLFNKEPHKHSKVQYFTPYEAWHILAGRHIPIEVLRYLDDHKSDAYLPFDLVPVPQLDNIS